MKKLLFLMICMSSVAVAQTSTMVDPATRIAWPRITGAGTPASLGFTCTATNYGQPFLDTATTPNTSSTCGTAGWQSSDGIATNAVVTNPSASQKVVQPYGTSLEVNYLEGILSQSFTDSARQRLSIWSRRMHYAPTTAGAATHVLIIGDSQTRCWVGNGCGVGPTLSSQRWGELVGQTLQGAFGSAGLGVQPLMFGFANPSQVDPQYYSVTGSVSYVATIGPTWTYGGTTQGSLMQLSSGQVVTFSTPVPYDTLKVACASATGSSGLSVAIDGSAAGTVCGETTSVPTAQYDASTTVGLAVHSATLTCATGPCFLWGVGGAAGNTGISVDYSAIASGGSGSFSSTSQLAIIDAMMMPDLPGLVIIDLGTNDTYLGTLTSLTANLEAIIANIIATATANGDSGFIPSFLLVVPPASNIASSSVMQQVAQNVIAAANATGVDVVSIQDRWGTSYVANQNLYGSDGIHPNTYGSGDEAATILQHVLDVVPSPVSSTNTWPYLQTFQAGIAAPYIEPLVTANPTGGCLTGAFLDATTGVFSSCVGGVWIQGLKASVFEPSVATAPTGSCGPNGTLVLALDGSLSVCRGYVYGPLSGGVTSVGLALPSLFTVSGSPVTGSGTLTAILASQAANQVFANCTGSSATPSFCSLTAAMIPSLAATYAPLANPTAGQHNYAPLASPTFTGSVVIPGGTIDSTVIGGTTAAAVTATALTVAPVSGSQIGNFLTFYYDSARTEQAIIIDQAGGLRAQGGFYDGSNYLNSVAIGASQVVGPATAPTGSCSTNGAIAFGQDNSSSICLSGNLLRTSWPTTIPSSGIAFPQIDSSGNFTYVPGVNPLCAGPLCKDQFNPSPTGVAAGTATTATFNLGTDTTVTFGSTANFSTQGAAMIVPAGGTSGLLFWTGNTGTQLTGVTLAYCSGSFTYSAGAMVYQMVQTLSASLTACPYFTAFQNGFISYGTPHPPVGAELQTGSLAIYGQFNVSGTATVNNAGTQLKQAVSTILDTAQCTTTYSLIHWALTSNSAGCSGPSTGSPNAFTMNALNPYGQVSDAPGFMITPTFYNFTGNVTNGSTTVTSVSSFTGLYVGMPLQGLDTVAGTTITALNTGANTLTLSQAANGTRTPDTFYATDNAISTPGEISPRLLSPTPVLTSQLATCSSATLGAMQTVTDSVSIAFGVAPTGGGANGIGVECISNAGTYGWIVH